MHVIEETATQLLKQLWNEEPVRLLGVGVSGLSLVQQLSLWDNEAADNKITDNEVGEGAEGRETSKPDRSRASGDSASSALASRDLESEPPQGIQSNEKKQKHLQHTLTLLQEKFGPSIVQVAGQLRQNPPQHS